MLLVVYLAIFFLLKMYGITLTGITFVAGPRQVNASDGVIWLLPWERGHQEDGAGFVYQGASVSTSEKGGVLTVNGKYYGTLTTGDSVDLTTQGVVLVNGHPRQSH